MYLFLLLGAIVIITLLVLVYFNLLRLKSNRLKIYVDLETLMKKRHGYTDELVKMAKGYLSDEQDTIDALIQSRDMAKQSKNINQRKYNEEILSECINKLLQQIDSKTNLAKDVDYRSLKAKMELVEKQLSVAREKYKNAVEQYNKMVRIFPLSVLTSVIRIRTYS